MRAKRGASPERVWRGGGLGPHPADKRMVVDASIHVFMPIQNSIKEQSPDNPCLSQ